MENNVENNQKTILIVEDEPPIVDILVDNLKREGYNTLEAYDGVTAVDMAFKNKPDLILLDIMLPKMDGLTVCKKIRSKYNIPILMLTARNEEIDKILGLELGADDYVTKPFSVRELMARIKANLRKSDPTSSKFVSQSVEGEETTSSDKVVTVGNLVLDLEKIEVKVDGRSIDVTLKEFEFLKYLALKQGQAVSREELLKNVWKYDYIGDERTVDVLVRRLRKKMKDDTEEPKILITKRGIGYYLKSDKLGKE